MFYLCYSVNLLVDYKLLGGREYFAYDIDTTPHTRPVDRYILESLACWTIPRFC